MLPNISAPSFFPGAEALTSAMAGIGMLFAAPPAREPNIEETLLLASMEAMEQDDLRVLSILVSWFGIHHPWVHAGRLANIVGARGSARVRALWSALASWQARDRRFARLLKIASSTRLDVLAVGTDFQVRRHGEDMRFRETLLRVPANVLRDRASDVLSPTELARRHHAYRCRVMMGPTDRADIWAALEMEPTLSMAELAERTHAPLSTLARVKRDFEILASLPAPRLREPSGWPRP